MKSVLLLIAAGLTWASTVTASPVQIQLKFATSPAEFNTTRKGTILDVLREEKRFSRLLEVIERSSGLRDDLEGNKMVTLFAPTDDAWEYMEDTLRAMRKNRRRMNSRDDLDAESRKGRHGKRADDSDEVDADSRKGRRGRRDDDDDDDEDEDANRRRRGRRGRRDDDDEDDKDNRRRRGRRGRRGDDDDYDQDIEEILRYHIVKEELRYDDLYEGLLLPTELRESGLDDKRQKIRVFEFFNNFYLNMHARVGRSEMRAENGVVHSLDIVLCPPVDALEQMAMVPFVFSTFLTAAAKANMMEKLEDERAITIFAPDNNAWMQLGAQNILYLFSVHGRKDLKRIVQYHIGREILYSTHMMKDKKIKVETLLKGEDLEISSCERGENRGGRGRRGRGGRGGRRDRDRDDEDLSIDRRDDRDNRRDETPMDFVFVVNDGEARVVEHCMDFLTDNGVVQPINAVLIPRDVELPFALEANMM